MRLNSNPNIRETLNVAETAKVVGCGERAIRRAIDEGRIPHIRMGRNILIPRSALLRWLDAADQPNT